MVLKQICETDQTVQTLSLTLCETDAECILYFYIYIYT